MARQVRIAAPASWPGLAQNWSGQEIFGILLGTVFAAARNVAVAGRWIWRDALPSGWVESFAILAAASWLAILSHAVWREGFRHPDRHRLEIDRLFREAHEVHLQGRWAESRRRIERILQLDESAGDAIMPLVALDLRINPPSLARRTFRRCLESKQGAKWRWEIPQELGRLSDIP